MNQDDKLKRIEHRNDKLKKCVGRILQNRERSVSRNQS